MPKTIHATATTEAIVRRVLAMTQDYARSVYRTARSELPVAIAQNNRVKAKQLFRTMCEAEAIQPKITTSAVASECILRGLAALLPNDFKRDVPSTLNGQYDIRITEEVKNIADRYAEGLGVPRRNVYLTAIMAGAPTKITKDFLNRVAGHGIQRGRPGANWRQRQRKVLRKSLHWLLEE